MKNLATFVGVCLTAALIGCSSTQKTAVSPGAVEGSNGKCCASSQASPGAVGDAKCAAQCPHAAKTGEQVSPGTVGETKASGCNKAKTGEQVSPGAVGETKSSGCCKAKAASGG